MAGRKVALKESRDRTTEWRSDRIGIPGTDAPCLADLAVDAASPRPIRYAYRSFDRQWALYDARLGDYLKPPIWAAHGPNQIYLSTLLATPLGFGPAATFCASIPDLHHFRGSFGGKDLIPLFRDSDGQRPNVTSGLLGLLGETFGRLVTATDLLAYVAGVLGGRSFTARFWTELGTPGLRIPITKSQEVFERVAAIGRRFINLETFGERFADNGSAQPARSARIATDIPHTSDCYPNEFEYDDSSAALRVGAGVISGVSAAVWAFEVSGLRVVESWLSYRMRSGAGRTSSPLDSLRPRSWTATMTEELLDILWALEGYISIEPAARDCLEEVISGTVFNSRDLPTPTAAERVEPRVTYAPRQSALGL